MSTRMTVSTIEFVAKGATNAVYSSKITSIRDEMSTIGDEVYKALLTNRYLEIMEIYHNLFPKHQKLRLSPLHAYMDTMDVTMTKVCPVTGTMDEHFTIISHIRVMGLYKSVDGGNLYSWETVQPEYIANGMCGIYGTYTPLVCKHLYEYKQKQNALDIIYSEKIKTYNDIVQRLRSYSTVKRAYDDWPEIRQFLPSVKNPDKVTTYSTTDKLLREVQNGRKDQNQQKG